MFSGHMCTLMQGSPGDSYGKESACNVGDPGSISGMGRSPGGGAWQPTPVFLPGEFHGRRSWVVYSPWDRKDRTWLSDYHFQFSLFRASEYHWLNRSTQTPWHLTVIKLFKFSNLRFSQLLKSGKKKNLGFTLHSVLGKIRRVSRILLLLVLNNWFLQ